MKTFKTITLDEDEISMMVVALGQLRVTLSKPQRRIDGSEIPRIDVDNMVDRSHDLEYKLTS